MATNKNANYLAHLNSARAGQKQPQKQPADIGEAMADIKKYSEALNDVSADDLKELNDLMEKVDNLSGVFEKYANLQGKMESLKANAALLEKTMAELETLPKEIEIAPLKGYDEKQTIAINVQLVEEFENQTRLSKEFLKKSESQELEEEVPEEVPALEGLTKEQTVQVFMQLMVEFEEGTELAEKLAYNAEV